MKARQHLRITQVSTSEKAEIHQLWLIEAARRAELQDCDLTQRIPAAAVRQQANALLKQSSSSSALPKRRS